MDSITLKNFRCFREEQTVRLAPLTLLVGENSTGKTSFLAMVRILSQLGNEWWTNPDFKQAPYDLGSFNEIAHYRGGRIGRAESFEVGFQERMHLPSGRTSRRQYRTRLTFRKRGSAPIMAKRRVEMDGAWVEQEVSRQGAYLVSVGTPRGTWRLQAEDAPRRNRRTADYDVLYGSPLTALRRRTRPDDVWPLIPLSGSPPFREDDWELLQRIDLRRHRSGRAWTFASGPVRSKPRRTYDPARLDPDPEGDYVPMYLADLASRSGDEWGRIKIALEQFGADAGLFDEFSIRNLGTSGSDPFQIQVRKRGGTRKGQPRNLIDVGYGVSQVLPLITELLRLDGAQRFLLQQPEVHLHPSAQAALGSLFCEVAASGRQLIVETHSDHLIDRVRMDLRDGKIKLTPDDVRILYFERDELDVKIHELWWDENGNIENAPSSYRRFFMQEVERSIWPD